jgi:hypothetical protein
MRPAKHHESRAVQQSPSRSTKPFVFKSAVIANVVLSTLLLGQLFALTSDFNTKERTSTSASLLAK